ncbi:hypothetical protein F5Y19DRAFT_369743 [Xylariaceae sp. FL1651]|nr:hypothetical protein F5Y19DRAFT_369743 [Xylariaceae sp. FL1651]
MIEIMTRILLPLVAALVRLAACSQARTAGPTLSCKVDVTSPSWKITDFEWRTGYLSWSHSGGVGPVPPPPPLHDYYCGAAMLRMNITSTGTNTQSVFAQEQTIPCVEQTSDAKLSNITNMTYYNAGPSGSPPESPHWFTCDMNHQLFIYPDGLGGPWPPVDRLGVNSDNVTTKIRLDPIARTLEVAQTWNCSDDGSGGQVETTGIARLPSLKCRDRTILEPDASFLVNSPLMVGPSLGEPVYNGSVCLGSEFVIEGHVSD